MKIVWSLHDSQPVLEIKLPFVMTFGLYNSFGRV